MSESERTRVIRGSNDVEASTELGPGASAGEYVIRAVLASGGHGTVYEAEHRVLGRRAAIKVLHQHLTSHGEMLQRFVREARVVNQIRHPNIVDVYDYGMLPDGSPYYVMELLGGTTLANVLHLRGRMSPVRALAYLDPICAALHAAHNAGVVHRDLKASNIVVVEDGDLPRVKLLDFGIAKLVLPDATYVGLTVAGQRLGTPYAMAPEQIRGTGVDHRTDIYALGVLLYQLLTGEYPFRSSDDLEVERMHLSTPPPRPSVLAPVAPSVDAVVLRCMEKDSEQRYQHVGEFIDALRQAVNTVGPDVQGRPVAWSATAIGLYIEVDLDDAAHEDDELLARVSELLEKAERELQTAGFLLPLQTGTAVLGVRVLPTDDELARREKREALEVANALHARTSGAEADPRIQARICVHVDKALVRKAGEALEIVGGPIARTSDWLVRDGGRFTMTANAWSVLSGRR